MDVRTELRPGDTSPAGAWGFFVHVVEDDVIEGAWLYGKPDTMRLTPDQVIMVINRTGPDVSFITFMEVTTDGPRMAHRWLTVENDKPWPPEMFAALAEQFHAAAVWESWAHRKRLNRQRVSVPA